MNKSEFFILIAAVVFMAFRLYQKYVKKDQGASGNNAPTGSKFISSSNDDDYEPYSGK